MATEMDRLTRFMPLKRRFRLKASNRHDCCFGPGTELASSVDS